MNNNIERPIDEQYNGNTMEQIECVGVFGGTSEVCKPERDCHHLLNEQYERIIKIATVTLSMRSM